jgi:hypothetical protein
LLKKKISTATRKASGGLKLTQGRIEHAPPAAKGKAEGEESEQKDAA